MNSGRLFFKRFKDETRFHYETFNWVLPKLYWFYFLGPYLFFIVAFYREVWENPFDYWPAHFPFRVAFAIALLFLSFDSFRSYIQSADLLYILQKKSLTQGLRIYGFFLSLLQALLQVIVAMVLLLPLFRTEHLLEPQVVGRFALVLFAYKMASMLLRKQFLYDRFDKLLGVLLFALTLTFYDLPPLGSMLIILGVAIIYLHGIGRNDRFQQEISLEAKEKHRFMWLIFLSSALGSLAQGRKPLYVPTIPTLKANRPQFLFRDSRRVFSERNPENLVLEFCLKAFLRNGSGRNAYLATIGIPAGLGLFLPAVPQFILFFVMIIGSWVFASGAFDKIVAHGFFQIVPIEKELREKVDNRFCLYLVTPAMMLATLSWFFSGFI